MRRFTHYVAVVLAAFSLSASMAVRAQSTTSGDINGSLTDPTGALVPNATVTVTNLATGEVKSATSNASGAYRVSLLTPGTYKVSVSATGFQTTVSTTTVAAGSVTADNLQLRLGETGVTVEVTGQPEIVNTENGDVSTVFTAEQVQALPNPGNDLTFVAQTAPGSVMNTGGQSGSGYGNFSSFGISGLSNMFTLDGGYENDPFLNLNNTGASNLTLGNNEVDTVTVISPAFSAQFGGLGGAQVNEITTSGANRVHGNLNYYWNGRVMNANDWFDKQAEAYTAQQEKAAGLAIDSAGQNVPQFVNANQWGAAIGGPVLRDKLFFYVNTEGLRVTTPTSGQVYAPSPAFQACVLNGTGCAALSTAGLASNAGVGPFQQAPASQRPLIGRIFDTYNTSPFRPAVVTPDADDPTAVSYFAHAASFLSEYLITARVDYHIGDKDNFYIHYKQDKGTQPTTVDLVSPLFSAFSPQPAWEGQVSETHSFTPNLTNQLVLTGNYYSAPFQNTNNYLPVAPFTLFFEDGDLSNTGYGGSDYAFPQGRRVSGYQVIDDVSYSKGRNTLRMGYNFRRDNVTDLPQVLSVASEALAYVEDFSAGEELEHVQRFPQRLEQPLAVYNEGAYVQDSFKLTPSLTVTAGLRVERNSNPKCITSCLQSLSTDVYSLPTGTAVPYNAAIPGGYILSGRHRAFRGYQKYAPMPRLSFNWQPFGTTGKTVVRGGFGVFSDTFPGSIADTLLSNAPGIFRGLVYGRNLGGNPILLDPSTAGSGAQIATASNVAFQKAFYSGGTAATTAAAVAAAGGVYSTPSFTTTAPLISYPTYEEYSLAVEQQIDRKSSVSITYVGNHGYHEPVTNAGRNLSSTTSTKYAAMGIGSYFPSVPTAKPIASFGTITNIYSGASSNYHGVVVSAQRRSGHLTLQFNYQFSHALDEVSNGGLEPFAGDTDSEATANPNNLHAQYGNADYNVKHNTTGNVVYDLPSFHKYKAITGGFQFSGTVFHQSGLPYTVTTSSTSVPVYNTAGTQIKGATGSFSNGTVNLFARQLNNSFDHHCGGAQHALPASGSGGTPCNFVSSFAGPTNFTQQGRNGLTGPSYTDVDFGAFKIIPIPHYESMKLKIGAQFFNLFNHPNFQNPGHGVLAATSSTYGLITSTVSSPTNIFGSVGANSSPRLIQLHGSLTF